MKRTKCRNIQTAVSNFERQQVQHCARLERMDSSIQRMTVLEKYYVGVRYQVHTIDVFASAMHLFFGRELFFS